MKNIENYFKDFIANLHLTSLQIEDAKTKHNGVCDCLALHFFERNIVDNDKFLFGSYKTKTNIRPLDDVSDVDVLFKISQEKYDQYKDNPEGLLQEVREALKEKYTTTDEIHAWGKIVLVKFSDGHHNVELLPALENEDGTFKIPNSEDGGSWDDDFDPRQQVNDFVYSNGRTDNLTREVVQMVKDWIRNTSTLYYKSFKVVEDVIKFTDEIYPDGKDGTEYDGIMFDFFDWMLNHQTEEHRVYINSFLETAKKRAAKAVEYANQGKYIEASEEWRKVFGDMFPKATENDVSQKRDSQSFTNAPRPWYGD